MVTPYDVDSSLLIVQVAKELKSMDALKPVSWAAFVKTSAHKERPPVDPDWWYLRAASVLRVVYLRGPIGVARLRMKYGGSKNRGHKPDRFVRASGNILRKILQQLEAAGLVAKKEKSVNKGRIVTAKGQALIDSIADKLAKGNPKQATPKKEAAGQKKQEEKPAAAQEDAPRAEQKAKASAKKDAPKAKPAEESAS